MEGTRKLVSYLWVGIGFLNQRGRGNGRHPQGAPPPIPTTPASTGIDEPLLRMMAGEAGYYGGEVFHLCRVDLEV